jgi:dolichyldiphosphatase
MGGVQSVFLMKTPAYESRAVIFAPSFCKFLPGDKIGGLSCLLALSPFFILVSLGTLLLSRRDPATALFALGLCVSTVFNDALKLVFKDPRPCSNTLYCSISDGDVYGMPSGHSQFMFFGAAYTAAWALSGRWRVPLLQRLALTLGAFLAAACVAVSRLYLHVHTSKQVAVGSALGCALGLLWFCGVEAVRPAFAWLAASPLGRALRIRDCSHCDVLTVEYEAVVAAERALLQAQLAHAKALRVQEQQAAAPQGSAEQAAGGAGAAPQEQPPNPPTSSSAEAPKDKAV